MTALLKPARRNRAAALRDCRGVAAVEFAFILPVALLLMGLIVYGGQIYAVQRKVSLSAATVANLVAQGNNDGSANITTAELNQILAYPNLILYPNNPAGVQVVVSELSVTYNSSKDTAAGTVQWSCPSNATAHPINTQMPVDKDIAQALSSTTLSPSTGAATLGYVILSEVVYPFRPYGVTYVLPEVNLQDSIKMIPRTTENGVKLQSPPANCSYSG
jgi:Flp pilus assembly protein TadG